MTLHSFKVNPSWKCNQSGKVRFLSWGNLMVLKPSATHLAAAAAPSGEIWRQKRWTHFYSIRAKVYFASTGWKFHDQEKLTELDKIFLLRLRWKSLSCESIRMLVWWLERLLPDWSMVASSPGKNVKIKGCLVVLGKSLTKPNLSRLGWCLLKNNWERSTNADFIARLKKL